MFVNTSILVTVGAIFFLFSLTCEATTAEWQKMIDRPARPRRTFLKAPRNERNMLLCGNRVQIKVTNLACWLGLFRKWKQINKGGGMEAGRRCKKESYSFSFWFLSDSLDFLLLLNGLLTRWITDMTVHFIDLVPKEIPKTDRTQRLTHASNTHIHTQPLKSFLSVVHILRFPPRQSDAQKMLPTHTRLGQ